MQTCTPTHKHFLLRCAVSLIKQDIRYAQRGRFNLSRFGKHSQTHPHTLKNHPKGVPVKQHVLAQSTAFAGRLPVQQILLAVVLTG